MQRARVRPVEKEPLPAGLGEAGDLSAQTEVAQGDTGQPEVAVVAAGPAGHSAAIANAHGIGVAWQGLQLATCLLACLIVGTGISEQLLRWKGIEATEKLANSPNTKVIIVGAGKDGLPIILDTK